MHEWSDIHLDEDGTIGAALCPHLLLGLSIEEVDSVSNVPPGALNRRVAIHIAEPSQAETVVILRGGLREAVHDDVRRVGMKFLLTPNICNKLKILELYATPACAKALKLFTAQVTHYIPLPPAD